MKDRRIWFLLLIILALGAFLRFYRIADYLTFLGDEGRDVLVVKRMIVDHKPTLLGPITSTGGMYLGPIYYYFMTPFLWLFRLDPVGPAVMVALFALATIFLIYKIGKEFFDEKVGLFAAALYSVSRLAIIYGRSSWNPNVLPFFSLFFIYSLLQVAIKKRNHFLFWAGLSLGVCFQLHYLAILLLPIGIVILLFSKIRLVQKKEYFYPFLGLISTFWPFLLFEARHQFPNTKTMFRFLFNQGGEATLGVDRFFHTFSDILVRSFWRLIVIENAEWTKVLIAGMIIFYVWYFRGKERKYLLPISLTIIWFLGAIIGVSFYKGAIYDYYMTFFFPAPFLLVGFFLSFFWSKKKWVAILIFICIFFLNIKNLPIFALPNKQLEQIKRIARVVFDETGGKPYNFALLATHNSDHAYRYFFEIWGNAPIVIENTDSDPQRKTVTDQLLIICEEKVCNPLGHPLWEVAGFGRAEIEKDFEVPPVKVFKLIHYLGD